MSKLYSFKGIIETTFRDGQESPLLFDTYKYRFNLSEKIQLLASLIKLGIRHFELFSPAVSQSEKNDFVELKKYSKSITNEKIYFIAHCRCHEQDIQQSIDLGFDGVNLYLGATKQAQKFSHSLNLKEILLLTKKLIINIRKKYPNLYIRFSGEDAFRTKISDIYKIYDQLYPYVDTFGLPDTVGIATPESVTKKIKALKKRYPKVNLECHFHNDRGLSLINSITAVKTGVEYIDCSIWGMAERSGITSITALLLNLSYLDNKLVEKYNLELCYPLNAMMGSILDIQVPSTEPVSLTNRTHTAGVHQKAVLNSKDVYEAHNLENFGVNQNQLFLGPLSGWNLIYYYLKEIKGYDLTKEKAKEITTIFKNSIDQINKICSPEHLLIKIVNQSKLIKKAIPTQFARKRIEKF